MVSHAWAHAWCALAEARTRFATESLLTSRTLTCLGGSLLARGPPSIRSGCGPCSVPGRTGVDGSFGQAKRGAGLGGQGEGDVTGGRGEPAERSHGRTLSEVMVIPAVSDIAPEVSPVVIQSPARPGDTLKP